MMEQDSEAGVFDPGSKSRKVLRRSIKLAFQNTLNLRAHTLEVSPTVITIMSPVQLSKGMICAVELEVMVDGEIRKINAVSKTGTSVCIGTEGFRLGLNFLSVDPSSRQTLNDWMNYPR